MPADRDRCGALEFHAAGQHHRDDAEERLVLASWLAAGAPAASDLTDMAEVERACGPFADGC
jgi:hypothetical protein